MGFAKHMVEVPGSSSSTPRIFIVTLGKYSRISAPKSTNQNFSIGKHKLCESSLSRIFSKRSSSTRGGRTRGCRRRRKTTAARGCRSARCRFPGRSSRAPHQQTKQAIGTRQQRSARTPRKSHSQHPHTDCFVPARSDHGGGTQSESRGRKATRWPWREGSHRCPPESWCR